MSEMTPQPCETGPDAVLDTRRRPILIVEDDAVDREMIGLAFRRAHVENPVITMANGEDALSYLRAQGLFQDRVEADLPAVIVLDLVMPQMDGFEFLRIIKSEPKFASIPVVVLTTSQYDQDLSRSYGLGASSCLTKPSDFEQLVEIAANVNRYWCRTNRIPGS
jgi:two-component system response regulator